MGIPKNCTNCQRQHRCNAVMYSEGCGYFPPKSEVKNVHPLRKFFGKFFK